MDEFNLENKVFIAEKTEKVTKEIESFVGASIDDIKKSVESGNWPYSVTLAELWKKFNPEDLEVVFSDEFAHEGKVKDIQESIGNKQWPFAISEEQMREANKDNLTQD